MTQSRPPLRSGCLYRVSRRDAAVLPSGSSSRVVMMLNPAATSDTVVVALASVRASHRRHPLDITLDIELENGALAENVVLAEYTVEVYRDQLSEPIADADTAFNGLQRSRETRPASDTAEPATDQVSAGDTDTEADKADFADLEMLGEELMTAALAVPPPAEVDVADTAPATGWWTDLVVGRGVALQVDLLSAPGEDGVDGVDGVAILHDETVDDGLLTELRAVRAELAADLAVLAGTYVRARRWRHPIWSLDVVVAASPVLARLPKAEAMRRAAGTHAQAALVGLERLPDALLDNAAGVEELLRPAIDMLRELLPAGDLPRLDAAAARLARAAEDLAVLVHNTHFVPAHLSSSGRVMLGADVVLSGLALPATRAEITGAGLAFPLGFELSEAVLGMQTADGAMRRYWQLRTRTLVVWPGEAGALPPVTVAGDDGELTFIHDGSLTNRQLAMRVTGSIDDGDAVLVGVAGVSPVADIVSAAPLAGLHASSATLAIEPDEPESGARLRRAAGGLRRAHRDEDELLAEQLRTSRGAGDEADPPPGLTSPVVAALFGRAHAARRGVVSAILDRIRASESDFRYLLDRDAALAAAEEWLPRLDDLDRLLAPRTAE